MHLDTCLRNDVDGGLRVENAISLVEQELQIAYLQQFQCQNDSYI